MSIEQYKHERPQLGERVFIHPLGCVIGRVQLGDDVSVWPFAAVRGDVNWIRIGNRTNIQESAVLHVTHAGPYTGDGLPLIVGDDVTVGHGAILHACTVGNRCLIGMGAIVLDGAIVEDDAMIAAGSLVPPGKRVTGGTLWMGQPAKPVRNITDQERTYLPYSAGNYVRLKDEYRENEATPSA